MLITLKAPTNTVKPTPPMNQYPTTSPLHSSLYAAPQPSGTPKPQPPNQPPPIPIAPEAPIPQLQVNS